MAIARWRVRRVSERVDPLMLRETPLGRRVVNAAGMPRLGVILVNWNRWADTIECLESLLRSPVPMRVVVVDNASSDDSVARIAEWAAGTLPATPAAPAMAAFGSPPVAKPLAVTRLTAAAAAATDPDPATRLTLIDGGDNLGFAGGNNAGLRHLLRDPQLAYFWLLNNDTVVAPDAPTALLARLDATHNVGMCGTVVRYYFRPDVVQALNGSRFNRLTGNSHGIGEGQAATAPFDPAAVARQTDFVLGASLIVSRRFVDTIGLMNESYFLYFEEIDWATRAAGRFVTAFAHGAAVYHKEGGSIGSSSLAGGRSDTSEYWLMRSKLAYVARFTPRLLTVHRLLAAGQIARRLMRRQPGKAAVMARALLGLGAPPPKARA